MPNLPNVKIPLVPDRRTIVIQNKHRLTLRPGVLDLKHWQTIIRGRVPAVKVLLVEVKSSELVSHNGRPGWYKNGAWKEFCGWTPQIPRTSLRDPKAPIWRQQRAMPRRRLLHQHKWVASRFCASRHWTRQIKDRKKKKKGDLIASACRTWALRSGMAKGL